MHLLLLLALLCLSPVCLADCSDDPTPPDCSDHPTPTERLSTAFMTQLTDTATTPPPYASSTTDNGETPRPRPTGVTKAPTAGPGEPGTTQFASTAAPTTTMGSTLPPVNISYVEFQRDSCLAGVCTYSFLAPKNDQKFLMTEQTQIHSDQQVYDDANQNVQALKANLGLVTDPDQAKVNDLRNQLLTAQKQLNVMTVQVAAIINNTQSAQLALDTANYYLNNMDFTDSCFVSCNSPPTPPPPTTTPTTPPTTTRDPCLDITCPKEEEHCELRTLNFNSQPYCTNCPGNLDGFNYCEESACYSEGVDSKASGPFFSPGFNINGSYRAYPNSSRCIWRLNATSYMIDKSKDIQLKNISPKSSLMIFGPGDTTGTPITSSTTSTVLGRIFSGFNGKAIEIHLQTEPNVPSSAYFQWSFH